MSEASVHLSVQPDKQLFDVQVGLFCNYKDPACDSLQICFPKGVVVYVESVTVYSALNSIQGTQH